MADGSLPNNIEQRSKGWLVVYKISEWRDYDSTPADEKNGWPWMANKEGELEVLLVLYDPDTRSFCVVVDE